MASHGLLSTVGERNDNSSSAVDPIASLRSGIGDRILSCENVPPRASCVSNIQRARTAVWGWGMLG